MNATVTNTISGDVIASNGAQFTSDADGILNLKVKNKFKVYMT